MARTATKTAGGRKVVQGTKPSYLGARGGTGRSRKATDFDDLVPEWYEACQADPALYFKIEAEGDSDEEKLADLEQIFKDLAKAVAYHNLGATRLREDDPEKPEFESYAVHVRVHERQKRGPEVGSIKDPDSGKRIGPSDETGRYQELVDMRERGEI